MATELRVVRDGDTRSGAVGNTRTSEMSVDGPSRRDKVNGDNI